MDGKKTKTPVKIHTLFLYTGYAEDSSLACLVAYHENGFDNPLVALKDFANKIVEHNMIELQEESKRKSCSHKIGPDDKFCPKCGAPRKNDATELPDKETVEAWMDEFIHGIAGGNGYLWQYLYENGWTCGWQAVTKESLSCGIVLIYDDAQKYLRIAHTETSENVMMSYIKKHGKIIF